MNTPNLSTPADLNEEIAALKKALEEKSEEIKKLKDSTDIFQSDVDTWMLECFGYEIAEDKKERNFRFLEEAIELVQANGCASADAHALVDYVFGRPSGEIEQECGGVMVTLAALSTAIGISMNKCGETELKRVWEKIDLIRQKQAAKKIKSGPLP